MCDFFFRMICCDFVTCEKFSGDYHFWLKRQNPYVLMQAANKISQNFINGCELLIARKAISLNQILLPVDLFSKLPFIQQRNSFCEYTFFTYNLYEKRHRSFFVTLPELIFVFSLFVLWLYLIVWPRCF